MDDEQRKEIYNRVYKPGFGEQSQAIQQRREKLIQTDKPKAQASSGLFDVIKKKLSNPRLGEADLELSKEREKGAQ